MKLGKRLKTDFFARTCLEVASELVGCLLVRRLDDGTRLAGRLVEVEAYLGDGSDPGSHSHRGPTPRNHSMFGPPGRLYVYRCYGIHLCLNVVCEPEGSGAAILLRALEPHMGLDAMRKRRGLRPDQKDALLAAGPGRLTQALGVDSSFDGAPLCRDGISLFAAAEGDARPRIARSPRVGVSKGAEFRYRFFDSESPWVSARRGATPQASTLLASGQSSSSRTIPESSGGSKSNAAE